MTSQAKNFAELCKGNDISKIKLALQMVKKSVAEELMDHYGVSDITTLAFKLQ